MQKTDSARSHLLRFFRRCIFKRTCSQEFSNSFLTDAILPLKAALDHIHRTSNALTSGKIEGTYQWLIGFR